MPSKKKKKKKKKKKNTPLDKALDELDRRADAERQQHAKEQELVRARVALQKALLPLIRFEGPDDPREWEREYARLVIDAAEAVRTYTGWKTLRTPRLPKKSDFRVAHELFRLAYGRSSVDKLTAKVRKVMERLARKRRRRSVESAALRDYYDWLWKHVREQEPHRGHAPRPAGRVADPDPEAFRAGYRALLAKGEGERLGVERVIEVYGLGHIDPERFSKSPRYVQTAGKPLTAWRLPHVPARWRSKRDKATQQFRTARWWTAREVRTAMGGLAKRLGIDLKGAPGPF